MPAMTTLIHSSARVRQGLCLQILSPKASCIYIIEDFQDGSQSMFQHRFALFLCLCPAYQNSFPVNGIMLAQIDYVRIQGPTLQKDATAGCLVKNQSRWSGQAIYVEGNTMRSELQHKLTTQN